jgi:hypothetical protein
MRRMNVGTVAGQANLGGIPMVVLVCIFAVARLVAAESIAGYLNLSSAQPEAGKEVHVEVVLDLGEVPGNLGAYEGHLAWNPEVLELVEARDGGNEAFTAQHWSTGGELIFSGFGALGGEGRLVLLTMEFRAVGKPGGATALKLDFPILVAAQTFVNLRESLRILPTVVRIAGGEQRESIQAWIEHGENQGGIFETEVLLDLSEIPEKLGAYEGRLEWDPEVLELVEVLEGDTEAFAGGPRLVGADELVFSGFNPQGADGKLSLLRARFTFRRETSSADGRVELSFSALVTAGDFADLLPLLEIRSDAVSSVTTHSWGNIKLLRPNRSSR